MNNQLNDIKAKIEEYKLKYFTRSLINGVILLLSICLIAFLFITLLEYYGNFDRLARKILFFTLITIVLVASILHLFIPLKNLIFRDEKMSDDESSIQIGKYFPEIRDKLRNTLQLSQLNYSDNALILASISQKTEELKPFTFKNAIDFEESKKYLAYYLFFPLLLFLGLLVFNHQFITTTTDRLIHYNQQYEIQAPFKFELQNNELSIFEGENIDIKLNVSGKELPQEVYIVSENGRFLMQEVDNQFVHTLFNINQDHQFWFEAAGYNSKSYVVQIKSRPNIEKIEVSLEYPAYLHRQNTSSDNIGNLSVPEGTKITWKINTKKTEVIDFNFDNNTSYKAEKQNDDLFELNKRINKNTQYSITLKNKFGTNKEKIQYSIESIQDKHPSIQLDQYSDTVFYSYLLLGGSISDDYGISQLKLSYRIENESTPKNNKYTTIPLAFNKNLNNQNFVYQLQLQDFKLKPGDNIDYFVTVYDNDGVNGSKATKSRLMHFEIPTQNELEDKLEMESEQNKSQLSDAISKSEKINAELKKLNDQLKTKKELSWQDKKDIEKVLQKHRELQSEIEQLNQDVQMQNEQKNRFEEPNPELSEKMKKLQDLMNQMIDPETQKLMEELQKLLNDKSNLDEIKNKLEELNKKDESFEKEIDRALEMYKQMEFEQKLENNIDKLNELSKKQEELKKETDKATTKEELQDIKEKQDALNKEFDELKKNMKEMEKMNEELENKHDLSDIEKDKKDVDENMDNSSEQLDKNNKKNASQSQQNASDQMKKMAQKMKDMKQEEEKEMLEENIEDLKKIMDNLIKLSFNQENIINKLSSVKSNDPLFIEYSQKQLNIERDAAVLEDSLYSLAKRLLEVEGLVTKEVTEMKNQLKESSEFIKQRNIPQALVKQRYAMTSMNNLALMLDDLLDNLQAQMSQQKDGNQMCQKPGNKKGGKSGKPKPSMGDMQKEINEMIKQLQQGQKQGKSMSSELAKAAARQEMLRRGLQELQKGGTDGKENQKMSEEIKKMEKAMEETEKDLLNNRLSDKTLNRQQEILTRLLEAENASREREYDEKRKGTEAKNQSKDLIPNYEQYLKEKQKQIELLQTIPPALTPYYKKEVNEYFENIDK